MAVVTGAASGIGRAVASRLQDEGFEVLAVDLRPDPDGPGVPHEADLTDADANANAVKAALDRFGRLDVVVANAGVQHVAPVEEFPVDRWQSMIALLLTSPFLLARAAWPALRDSGDGRFIAIASAHALVASPYKSAYVSAKHGVLGLVKTLALEGADQGISAVAVCPGYVRTPLVEKQIGDQARAHGISEDAGPKAGDPRAPSGQAADRARADRRRGRVPDRSGGSCVHRNAGDARPRLERAAPSGRRASRRSSGRSVPRRSPRARARLPAGGRASRRDGVPMN